MKKAGIIVIVLGVLLTVFTAITFFTKENVVDIGTVKITANKPHHLSWSPMIGIAVIGAGGILLMVSTKRKLS